VQQGTNPAVTELQSIAHEEGRIRVITPYAIATEPGNVIDGNIDIVTGKRGSFDYFIKDHLGSTRSIITEEIHKNHSVCTMEINDPARKQHEESLFGNTTNNEVSGSRFATSSIPNGWQGNSSAQVCKLQSLDGTTKIGPNVILKVMAGDLISLGLKWHYKQDPGPSSSNNGLAALVQSLVKTLGDGKAGIVLDEQANNIGSFLSSNSDMQTFFNSLSTIGSVNNPKAYLNMLFFDEQFNYIQGSAVAFRVSGAGSNLVSLSTGKANRTEKWVRLYLCK
jgi:hypothetical protein